MFNTRQIKTLLQYLCCGTYTSYIAVIKSPADISLLHIQVVVVARIFSHTRVREIRFELPNPSTKPDVFCIYTSIL